MLQQALDIAQRHLRQLVLGLGIEEGVVLAAKQRLVGVHAAAVHSLDRLGHERGEEAVAVGHIPDDELEGGEIVRRDERIGVLEVDLVLAGGHLVVGGLDLETHLRELLDDHPPDLLALVERAQVEVGAGVVRRGGGRAVGRVLEEKELRFTPRHHREAELSGPGELALERRPGTAGEGLLIGGIDVAEKTGHPPALVVVRQDPEGLEVGLEEHVRLLDPHEALDRGAVEHDLAVERLVELAPRYLDVLVDAEDVGELQAEEVHPELTRELEDVRLGCSRQVGGETLQARALCRRGSRAVWLGPFVRVPSAMKGDR